MAAEYHWPARQIECELTDELLVLYFDAASDRITSRVRADFRSSIEAVRAGTIFAHDNKQYRRWTSSHADSPSAALSGAHLEQAVMSLARSHPEYVVVGP